MEELSRRSQKNKTQINKKKVNVWKFAFLILAAVLIGFMALISVRVLTTPEGSEHIVENTAKVENVAEISTTKKELNALVQTAINQSDLKKNDFTFRLDKKVILTGSYEILGVKIPIYLYLIPTTLEDGNIELQIDTMSVGTLAMPKRTVLSMVKQSSHFPEYVEILSSKEKILIHMEKITFQKEFGIKASMVDLVNDKFIFKLYKK